MADRDEQISAYLDGAMPAADAARFDAVWAQDPVLSVAGVEWLSVC